MVDILDSQVQGGFVTIGEALLHTKSGCSKRFGVFGTGRILLEPQISTFTKHRVKGSERAAFWGFLAPTGTPQARSIRLRLRRGRRWSNRIFSNRCSDWGQSGKLMAAVRPENR